MAKRGCLVRACSRAICCESLETRVLFSLPATWTSVGAGGGGSFFEPSFNPINPSEIWVATDQSDEYHSTNEGASWTVPSFTSIQGNHAAPVQYTSTPNLLYALGPSNYPQISTNDGQTWTLIANNPAGNADSLIVNYNNPNEFFISSYSQIYFTNNNGTSYTTINSSSGYVAGAYFNGSNIYLATDQGLLTSTNGGTSFSSTPIAAGIASGDGIFSFAGSTAGGVTKFFAVTATDSDIYPGQEGNICYNFTGVYSFTVGQSSWQSVGGIPTGVDPAFVSMVPNDINDITLAGGSDSAAPTVITSTNSGGSWSNLFDTTNNANIETGWQGDGGVDYGWGYGEFAMGFAQNPSDPGEMMITDEGGAYLSTNGGALWEAVYVTPADLNPAGSLTPTNLSYKGNGMENTSSWDLTFTNANDILASFTDITGISSTDGGATWSFNDNNGNSYNTTYDTVIQPGTGNLYAAVSSIHDIYQWDAYQTNSRIDAGTGAVLISTNGGSNWNMLHNFNHPVVWEEIDPNHPDTMYVSVANSTGAGGIYMTSDLQDGASSTWKQLAAPPRTEGHPLDIDVLNDGTLVVTYAGTLGDSGYFDDSAGVFVSTNQGESWTDVTAGTPAMQYFDRDITIDPNDPTQDTWYVGVWETTSNPYYPEGGVYKTTNRGQSWSLVPGLPDQEFSQVAFNPSNTNEMYITTGDDGLWYTANAESATPTFEQVSSYPFVAPQRVFFNPYNPNQVWVTSFGYGLAVGEETVGAPTQIAFDQQPTNVTAGAMISPSVTVAVEDAGGDVVTTDHSTVTISLDNSTGTLAGTLSAAAVDGIATFSDLTLHQAGSYQLTATDGDWSDESADFTVSAGAMTDMTFTRQPTNVRAGRLMKPGVSVSVTDAFGNPVSGKNVRLEMASGPNGANLDGTLKVVLQNGMATFSDVSMTEAGTYTLEAIHGGRSSAPSDSFTVKHAGAAQLVFVQQPTPVATGSALTPAVVLDVEDPFGNLCATNTSDITLSLQRGPLGAMLSGTFMLAATDGAATFSDVLFDLAGIYKLKATDGNLAAAKSVKFAVGGSPP